MFPNKGPVHNKKPDQLTPNLGTCKSPQAANVYRCERPWQMIKSSRWNADVLWLI